MDIHYNNLRKWLIDNGYVRPEGFYGIGAALNEFEEDGMLVRCVGSTRGLRPRPVARPSRNG
jgi:hypothetical protein